MSVRRLLTVVKPGETSAPFIEAHGSTEATFFRLENLDRKEPAFYGIEKRLTDADEWIEHEMGDCDEDKSTTFQLAPASEVSFRLPPSSYRWRLVLRSPATVSPVVAISVTISKGILFQVPTALPVIEADALATIRDSLRSEAALLIYVAGLSEAWEDSGATIETSLGGPIGRAENLAVGGADLTQAVAGSRAVLLNEGLFADSTEDHITFPDAALAGGNFLISVRVSPFDGASGRILDVGSTGSLVVSANPLTVSLDGTPNATASNLSGDSVITVLRDGTDLIVRLNGAVLVTYDATGFDFGTSTPFTLFSTAGDSFRGLVTAAYVGNDPDLVGTVETSLLNFP